MINKGILIDRQFDAELFADNLRLLREGKGLRKQSLVRFAGSLKVRYGITSLGVAFRKSQRSTRSPMPLMFLSDLSAFTCSITILSFKQACARFAKFTVYESKHALSKTRSKTCSSLLPHS